MRAPADVWLGARLAFSGGTDTRVRTTLTAIGVAVGVLLLLLAASTPNMLHAHSDRTAARTPQSSIHGVRLLMLPHTINVAGHSVGGWAVERVGHDRAPLPPGVRRLPGPGEMVVSPALERLLHTSAGAALERPLADARVVGTITQPGLGSPTELYAYLGARGLAQLPDTIRVERFGQSPNSDFSGPVLTLLLTVMVIALLLPIGTFVATASRFGGEERNRRLAALRLLGADRAMSARIAAGEALLGSVLGLALGCALFFTVLRPLMPHISVAGLSVFASDVQPAPALVVLTVVLVPAAAVLFALAAMRQVVIEPLGVERRARPAARRLWWRLLTPLLGFALLLPLIGHRSNIDSTAGTTEVVAGIVLVLTGVCALLPWAVDALVRGAGSGPVPWLLAVRRLQAQHGTAGRVAGAIGIAVAGAIALQTVFSGVDASAWAQNQRPVDGAVALSPTDGVTVSDVVLHRRDGLLQIERRLRSVSGAASVDAVASLAEDSDHGATVAGCPTITRATGHACTGAMIFLTRAGDGIAGDPSLSPGQRLRIGARTVTVPSGTRIVRISPADLSGLLPITTPLITLAAAQRMGLTGGDISALVIPAGGSASSAVSGLDQRVQSAITGLAPLALVTAINDDSQLTHTLHTLQNVLTAGAVAVLAVIGFSLLVSLAEQLRERRQVLAVLAAFGTRTRTLAWSVLWQTALLIIVGLTLAVAVGAVLGLVLMHILALPASVNIGAVGLLVGAGLAVVAAVTALSLPMLWLQTRPDGLRTE